MYGKKSYGELLRDPRWQKRRLERLERAEWQCECCCNFEATLHVHHRHYVKGRRPWDYDDRELVVVCEDCHENQHIERGLLMEAVLMALPGMQEEAFLAAVLAGWITGTGIERGASPDLSAAIKMFRRDYEAARTAAAQLSAARREEFYIRLRKEEEGTGNGSD